MSRIRRSDTKPERIVRKLLHAEGYRFRLQWKAAPGRPDIAFPARRRIIFVHGCFWHQHEGCRHARTPGTRSAFWQEKFDRNRARDARDLARAEAAGWRTLVVWECETGDAEALSRRLRDFVGPVRWIRPVRLPEDLALRAEEGRLTVPSAPPRVRFEPRGD